jgi:hypothetical protein
MVPPVRNDRNLRIGGNRIEQDVASHPAGAACCDAQRFSLLNRGQWECEMGNKNYVLHSPSQRVILKCEQIRSSVFSNCANHRSIGSVHNSAREDSGLRLQLEARMTARAVIINRWSIDRGSIETGRLAIRAVKVRKPPRLGCNSGPLRFTRVTFESCQGQRCLHQRIRSFWLREINLSFCLHHQQELNRTLCTRGEFLQGFFHISSNDRVHD